MYLVVANTLGEDVCAHLKVTLYECAAECFGHCIRV